MKTNRFRKGIIPIIALSLIMISCSGSGLVPNSSNDNDTIYPWIDTHAHIVGHDTDCTTESCLESVLETMSEYGVEKTILMHPPGTTTSRTREQQVQTAVSSYSDVFFYGAGGNTLNSIIQATPEDGVVSDDLKSQLEDEMEDLEEALEFVCLGEMAALHLSYNDDHVYEMTMPNTDLFYQLADYAESYDVPIDLHIDVVSANLTTPSFFTEASSLNPAELEENITEFEEFISYNRNAKIIWDHVGRDTTGQLTVDLVESLLKAHSNLYIQLHPVSVPLLSSNAIVDITGDIRTEWYSLLENYSDRIVLGSDSFYDGASDDGGSLSRVQSFLQQLPEDLAYEIGCENPVKIYNLSSGCE